MQRHRVLIIFGAAWLSAILLSWWVYKNSTTPQTTTDTAKVVAAARDLAVGKRLEAEDLKLVAMERKDLPKGAFLKPADLVNRVVSVPVIAGELMLNVKLAAKGGGEGLAALIEPGMRAISVQVNEISGVSGFIQPGTRVDVLFTRIFSNGDASTTTILHNVKVIAYGRQLDTGAKLDPRDTTKPTVATLLVSQQQAEKLALAAQRGKIQLVLRNALDDQITETVDPIRSADLGIDEPEKPITAPRSKIPVMPLEMAEPPYYPVAPPMIAKTGKPEIEEKVVRIFRGDKVTEVKFE